MAEQTMIKPANLKNVVERTRNVIATRYYQPLDSALLSAKAASEILSSAEQDFNRVKVALRKVDETITAEAELRSAKDAIRTRMVSLDSGISEIQLIQGWLAPFEDSTSKTLLSLERYALSALEKVLKDHVDNSHGMLTPARNDFRAFTFSQLPTTKEAEKEVLDTVAITESEEDISVMSIETILAATFGPLRSVAAILDIGKAYAERASEKLVMAAGIMDSSALAYTDVNKSIEGKDEHAKEAKKILDGLKERLDLESENAKSMRTVSESVTATVARILESIDEFTVDTLRVGLHGEVQEEVPMTPPPESETKPPVDGPAGEESQSSGEEAKASPMTLEDCLIKVADGEIDAVDSFVKDNAEQAPELIESLDRMARKCDFADIDNEGDRLNAVKALGILASGDRAVPILTGATTTLHGLWHDGPGDVRKQAESCLADLGAES